MKMTENGGINGGNNGGNRRRKRRRRNGENGWRIKSNGVMASMAAKAASEKWRRLKWRLMKAKKMAMKVAKIWPQ
jgi:hypothetical protein